ncbi:MAG TPA: putative metal-binding motif-containing protein [Polyangiaceae bacterium]|nr:putative metal-binding motif-containing protein [Polyangiaceae bacterium]
MLLKTHCALGALSISFAALALSCGARTSIYTSDAGVEEPVPCSTDLDCDTGDACAGAQCVEGTCAALPPVVCDDKNACTDDSCDSQSGQCSFARNTLDLDGDGHYAPKPGFAPGAPNSCGDDCDDRSASAHPGGNELCDGVDNDCNGKIDDNAAYANVQRPVRVSSSTFNLTNGAGMAFDGKNYGITLSGHRKGWGSYFTSVDRSGAAIVSEVPLTELNSDTFAGPLIYNGSYFASTWSDARQAKNYEIYFNRYDSRGEKLGPDLRVTNAPNFSSDPVLTWNGKETILVWDDRRADMGQGEDDTRLFGQRVAFDGSLLGDNVPLTSAGTMAELPAIALSQTRVGIVFASRLPTALRHVKFFTTAPDLTQPSAPVDLGGKDVQSPALVYVGGHFAAFWSQVGASYGPSIFGALVDETGKVLLSERPVTSGAKFARSFSVVSLGDRVIMVWADDHDGYYQLYLQVLDANLNVLVPRIRLTFSGNESLSPVAVLGPNGDLGVLFDDYGERQTYFLGMSCIMSGRLSP